MDAPTCIALRFFDRILPVSDHIGESLGRAGINRDRIITVRNAVDIDNTRDTGENGFDFRRPSLKARTAKSR